ncbi:helix-turn-helix domain-containing protein [Lactobacillus salsicarnum]|uniref:Helix-turn-helix domain-containing protein n=2 Tax=Companilactobacillus mishanensis TaxID=2486008 RepID=A0ABW9P699_9LACO|nr:helix-turn-helix domain-containing protein [Companilactobacillus mishanensis]
MINKLKNHKFILLLLSIINIISLFYLKLIIINSANGIYYYPFFKTMSFMEYISLSGVNLFEFVLLVSVPISYIFLILSRFSKDDYLIFLVLGVLEILAVLFLILNMITFQLVHRDVTALIGPSIYIALLHGIGGVLYGWSENRKSTTEVETNQAKFEGMEDMKPIGDILREKREAGNLTQQELADKIPVSRQTVHRWEAGKSHPDMEYMIKVAEILDFPVVEFWGNDSEQVNNEIGNVVKKRNRYRQSLYFLLTLILVSFTVTAVAFLGKNVNSPYIDMVNPFLKERTGYALVTQAGQHKAIVVDSEDGDGNIVTLNGYSNKQEFVRVVHKGSYVKTEVRKVPRNKIPSRIIYNLFYASHFSNLNEGLRQMQISYSKRDI